MSNYPPHQPAGATMRSGWLPIAYWSTGTNIRRTFYGVTREHAFQRALKWGRESTFPALEHVHEPVQHRDSLR